MNIDPARAAFGARVRELRLEHREISQEAFALALGIDRTYVSGIERGRRNPSLDMIVKLANGLGVQPWELLTTLPAMQAAQLEQLQ